MTARRSLPAQSDEEEDNPEAWLVTYSDTVTLLMAFFIMLVSFSKIDIPIYEQVKAGILDQLGKKGEQAKEQRPVAQRQGQGPARLLPPGRAPPAGARRSDPSQHGRDLEGATIRMVQRRGRGPYR